MAYQRLDITDLKTILTAAQVSHIEDGIVENESNIKQNTTDISTINTDLSTKLGGITAMESGYVTITSVENGCASANVKFSNAHNVEPNYIFLSIRSGSTTTYYANCSAFYYDETSTGFTCKVANTNSSTASVVVVWLAVWK